jgi:hypothetical protein
MSGANSQQAATAAERFAAAHKALLADGDIQFSMQRVVPPPGPPAWFKHLQDWLRHLLRPVGRFLRWVSSFMPDWPFARIILWTLIALLIAALVWIVVDRIRYGEWRLPRRRKAQAVAVDPEAEEWTPDAAPVRAWLQEADALAARGDYAEAVHHLLQRSIEDIERRRPRLVRPALTSRDIAATDAIPGGARALFAGIARLVERSLFGGSPVSQADWTEARTTYADFVAARSWAR